jgi:hypothetical protein
LTWRLRLCRRVNASIVFSTFGRIEQADFGGGDLVQQPRGIAGVLARLEVAYESALPHHGGIDDIAVLFVGRDTQQLIVRRWPLAFGDAQPFPVWIEHARCSSSSFRKSCQTQVMRSPPLLVVDYKGKLFLVLDIAGPTTANGCRNRLQQAAQPPGERDA